MIDLNDLKVKIEKILNSQYYEGDFGDVIDNADKILSNFNKVLVDKGAVENYIKFIQNIGFGELDASFYIEDGPISYKEIYRRNIPELEGMYIFASDQSEYSFAFDTQNNWQVVSIDASGNIVSVLASEFSIFIESKLNELLEIVEWRDANL